MESEEVMRRRMNMLAAHFVPTEDISPTHLLPLNCSSSLNSVISRRDNRMNFGCQSSASQAFFMRQALSTEQSQVGGVPFKYSASSTPLFSRPTRIEQNLSNAEPVQSPVLKDCKSPVLESDVPSFARPRTRIGRKRQSHSKKKTYSSQSNESEWSPRMDVVESARSYVLTVEIPGVNANDIRVEVNDQSLTIMGKRTTQCWETSRCSNDSITAYHKREILQGPCQVDWPFPSDANKNTVSAEFLDGFLQIIIPKL